MNKQLVKMAVNMIGRDKIKEAIHQGAELLTEAKNTVVLVENETDTILIVQKSRFDNKIYGHIFTVNEATEPPLLQRHISTFNIVEKITAAIETI